MKTENVIMVVAGVLAFSITNYYLNNRKERTSNASGRQQIGTQPCGSSNDSACKENCENMGGSYNQNGDRKCYKNGVPISGGLFGIGRVAFNKQVR
jgi:hypothetical protein